MKINNEEYDEILMIHRGKNRKFNCVLLRANKLHGDLRGAGRVEIEFSDLAEVEMMIEMLEELKKDTRDRLGYWK